MHWILKTMLGMSQCQANGAVDGVSRPSCPHGAHAIETLGEANTSQSSVLFAFFGT